MEHLKSRPCVWQDLSHAGTLHLFQACLISLTCFNSCVLNYLQEIYSLTEFLVLVLSYFMPDSKSAGIIQMFVWQRPKQPGSEILWIKTNVLIFVLHHIKKVIILKRNKDILLTLILEKRGKYPVLKTNRCQNISLDPKKFDKSRSVLVCVDQVTLSFWKFGFSSITSFCRSNETPVQS